ncbi:MAG: hypothetical protein HQL57_00490 [Magnetococcales bacterium]|nr:hypothetical protein [Magnetococcales bacterium]MBF0155648.1 hypothetical protein [Magnetococcales bacterium]
MSGPFRAARLFWLGILLVTFTLSGCGYRFPGTSGGVELAPELHGATIAITGEGAAEDPLLAKRLGQLLASRLGMPLAGREATPSAARLQIELAKPERSLLSESGSGRTGQYRVVLVAQPVLVKDGKEARGHYPQVRGSASHYQLGAGATNRATSLKAEEEALNQLADSLISILGGGL